ncbi:Gem-associated 2 [Gossypium arboreum]|uniref:Gem-associated 2 n=1 Tax=Gossypium arboreum TaxID=29729 RepID=A0A0B0PFY1_GOSAR|nr:Gem-associated 2 [Gossypium arboreum]
MADYTMESDSHVCSKRRTTSGSEQQETSLPPHLSPSLYESTADHRDSGLQDCQEVTAMDHSSPKKKPKCFSLLSQENQEMGLHSFAPKDVSLSGFFEKEKVDDVENKEGSFGVQEVDNQVNTIEANNKEHLGTGLEFEEKRVAKGKALESENVLEAEKKRLLTELEVGNIFGFATNSSKIDDGNGVGGTKGLDFPVKGSLKIEVIDDTALIGSFPLPRTGNGSVKDEKKKKGEHEIDGKKGKRSRRKGKNVKEVLGESVTMRHMESTKIFEVQKGKTESKTQNKIMYSREELEALRFAKVGEQRSFWRDVYNSLGKDVIREYEDLGSWKHQKNTGSGSGSSSDTRHRFGKKAESPAIISFFNRISAGFDGKNVLCFKVWLLEEEQGMVSISLYIEEWPEATWKKTLCSTIELIGFSCVYLGDYSENVGNELEYMEDNEMENIYPFSFSPTRDVEVDSFVDAEEECIEDDDSDEDYTSILRPAFVVEGEPDFESGPPEDGLEYLRRVRFIHFHRPIPRWETAQIPKVKIAKPDRTILNKEQSVYMPQIPEIAKCPEHILPLKHWEDAFLADFSELRLALLQMEDPNTKISCKLPKLSVREDDLFQLPASGVIEKLNSHATGEVRSDQVPLLNAADNKISSSHNNSCPKTSISDACGDYPTLSTIQKMDSVARVLMLRKWISSVENMSSLSRSSCVWLFALCAAIDTPLDADTCASLRSLLRKCANLRAGKCEVDDEVIMLNILATISGRYFGQSET